MAAATKDSILCVGWMAKELMDNIGKVGSTLVVHGSRMEVSDVPVTLVQGHIDECSWFTREALIDLREQLSQDGYKDGYADGMKDGDLAGYQRALKDGSVGTSTVEDAVSA